MSKIKDILHLDKFSVKKKAAFAGALAIAVCVCAVSVMSENGTNGDSEIPKHDGDVLVDSLSLSAVTGTSDAGVIDTSAEPADAAVVTSDDISEVKNADTYFEEVRATVNMDRNQIVSMLTDVIDQSQSTSEKDNAVSQKLKIIDYMNKEKIIENLIGTKGLPECLVLITDNAVNVTVKKQDLTQSDVAKICDIIMRETGRGAGQIVIQSKI